MTLFSSVQFWYLCGIAEDAYVHRDPKKGGYEFDLDTKSLAWLQEVVQPLIESVIGKKIIIRPHTNRPHYRLRFWHKDLVTAILDVKRNPEQVRAIDANLQKQWIAGFFDAEGSATKTGTHQPMLSIYSADHAKIKLLQELMKQFSLRSGVYRPKERSVWQLFLTGRGNVQEFSILIPFRHPTKRARIKQILET